MKSLLLFCFALWTSINALAQGNTLTVADVRLSSVTRPGTIEKAALSVRSQGLYMEYGLYLTFSAQGVTFNTYGDSLEVVLNFTLPENAIVHDSWLWVGDDIVKARIYDRWTANTIYEGVVKRRTDPSLLVKNSATQYQLRVFPMALNSTRRVKITWLQPIDFFRNHTELALPFSILKASKNTVPQFDVLVWSDDRFLNPAINNRPDLIFEAVHDTAAGDFSRITLAPVSYTDDVRLRFASPLQNGYYLSTYSDNDQQFYQLAALPSYFLEDAEKHRKIALALDYEINTGAPTAGALFAAAKAALLNNLGPGDSFNVFISKLPIQTAASQWLPANPETIESTFAALNGSISNYSNVSQLVSTAIQWVQAQPSGGEILLASNASQFANLQAANFLLNDLVALLQPGVVISVFDFNTNYTPYFYSNGVYYYANSYLFNNLAALSGGTYVKKSGSQGLVSALEASVAGSGASIESFDLAPAPQDGFCYGKFNFGNTGVSTTNLYRPVLQMGKFIGQAPFQLEVNGLYQNHFLHQELYIDAHQIQPADTLAREMWYGQFIKSLETSTVTNNLISNIIYQSLAERVLSRYSAFLCLDNPAWICEECEDETQFTSTDEPGRDSTLTAFPNPFTTRTTILVKTAAAAGQTVNLEIYDLHARLMRTFKMGVGTSVEWDGTDYGGREVPPGIYLGVLKIGKETRMLKLVKIRK